MRVAAVAALLVTSLAVPAVAPSSPSQTVPSLEALVGARLVVAVRGTTPSHELLARVREGRVGGVILFGGNVRNAAQVRALTTRLQQAARAGGRPTLLIAVDQEGGDIRRFRWAPPSRSAFRLGSLSPAQAERVGQLTASALRGLGVNVDLAPVADVPSVSGSFIARQERGFSTEPARVAALATSFAQGLARSGVAGTAKHFPGLGRAVNSTDAEAVTIAASRAQLAADLIPYRQLIAAGVPLVMLSNATYPALDSKPGAWSPAVESLLRNTLGFTGVTITDALDAVALTHHRSVPSSAVLAAQAGADLLLVAGSEAVSDAVFDRLLAAARAGKLPRANLERSYARILVLKRSLP